MYNSAVLLHHIIPRRWQQYGMTIDNTQLIKSTSPTVTL